MKGHLLRTWMPMHARESLRIAAKKHCSCSLAPSPTSTKWLLPVRPTLRRRQPFLLKWGWEQDYCGCSIQLFHWSLYNMNHPIYLPVHVWIVLYWGSACLINCSLQSRVGNIPQNVHHKEWCVELRDGDVRDMVIRRQAFSTSHGSRGECVSSHT